MKCVWYNDSVNWSKEEVVDYPGLKDDEGKEELLDTTEDKRIDRDRNS